MVSGPNKTKLVWKMRQHPYIFLSLFGYGYIFLLKNIVSLKLKFKDAKHNL